MKEIKLFDYQEDILRQVEEAFEAHRSVMVQMPTGTGKTYLLAAIVRNFAKQQEGTCVWMVAHRRELVAQIEDTLRRFGSSSQKMSRIKAMSIQWLSKHCDEMGEKPGLIVIDEAHHALADTYKVLWERYPKAKFLGLTATPCRLNRRGFTDLFDTLVSSYTVGQFIQMGYLAPFDYVSIRPNSEEQKLVDSLTKRGADGDFQAKEMDRVLNTRPSIERLYQGMMKYAKGKKGIVYAINISHARKIAEFYREHGVAAVAIDSKTPADERKRMIERFKSSNTNSTNNTNSSISTLPSSLSIQVLVNVDIFSEGFDCPDVEFIQLARPTLSLAKYLQMVGRGLRVTKGKRACVIIDNVGLYRMFGLPTMPWNWRAMFQGRFYRKRISDYRQMLLRGNDWERLMSLSGYDTGDDPEVMVLMRHERLMASAASDAPPIDPSNLKYQIIRKRYGYGVYMIENGSCGILQLYDNHMVIPPICYPQIQLLENRTAFVTIKNSNVHETFVDLMSGRSFDCSSRFQLSISVLKFGNISLLRVRNEFFTRTRKSYAVVFPISKDDISYHGFYLLIHDPMAKRKLPVCVIEGDVDQYYWLVEKLADGSIRVMTEEEEYYHVTPDGKGVKREERRVENQDADASRREENQDADAARKVEPVKIGSKWGMKVDGKLFVPPIYRNIRKLNDEYFAIEKWPGQWGIINMAGKVVVEPQYPKVELAQIKDAYMARLQKVNGQWETRKLE